MDEIKLLIAMLPKTLQLSNGINLVLDPRLHRGINNLNDIIWLEYKIINHEELEYDNIALTFFYIDENERIKASEYVIEKGVSKKETIRGHVDYKSGNIHPSRDYVLKQNNYKIKQLVLCSGLGPNTPNVLVNKQYYIYKNSDKQKGAKIHKACYYPLIEDDDSLKDNWRYQMLQEVWQEIQD